MDRKADGEGSESRFSSYVEHIASSLGHADRRTPFRSYCAGLILPGDRKSVEPIAARIEPHRVQGAHQSLHHFVANADWSQEDLLRRVRAFVVPAIEQSGRISAWIVDDTGFPKKGVHSVGVARQYCGQLGKQDNCQVAVSLSVANEHTSLPIAFRLYLPEDWAADRVRRAKAGVPADVVFKTKPQIALDQIKAARAEGVPEGVVLADAGYGINTAFRMALTRMGLTYVVGIQSSAQLWPPGSGPLPPKAWSGQGRPPTLMRRDEQNKPQSARQLAKSLSADAWRDVAWREGVDKTLHSRFASLRVRPAHRDYWRPSPIPKNGSSSNGRRAKAHRPNTGFRPCRPTPTSRRSSQRPKCAGGSSAIIRNSSRNSASITMKDEVGEAFTTTWRSASQPTDSWSPNEVLIPPSGDKILLIQAPRLSQGYRPRGSADPSRTPHQSVNRNHPH